MGFFQKVTEFNKLCKSFNKILEIIEDIENSNENKDKLSFRVMHLAYLIRIDITDKLVEYNWNPNSKIMLNNIKGTTTISEVNLLILTKVLKLGNLTEKYSEVSEILEKGEMFYTIHNLIK